MLILSEVLCLMLYCCFVVFLREAEVVGWEIDDWVEWSLCFGRGVYVVVPVEVVWRLGFKYYFWTRADYSDVVAYIGNVSSQLRSGPRANNMGYYSLSTSLPPSPLIRQ